jgi:hypothetical protein
MSTKQLKISLDLDDAAFTQAIKRMQKQLADIQSPAALVQQQRKISQYMQSQGMAPLTGSNERDQERAQQKSQQQTERVFQKTVTQLNLVKRLQADINKELSIGLASEERRASLAQRLATLSKKEKEYTGGATAFMPGQAGRVGGGVPGGGGFSAGDVAKGVLGALGVGLGIAGIASIAKQAYSTFVSAPYATNLATGSAVQSSVGYQNQNLLSGNIGSATMLQNQMDKSRKLAASEYDSRISSHVKKNIADELQVYLGVDRFKTKYEAERASEIGENTLKSAQSSIAQNNSLVLANDYFNQTFGRNLGAERGLGLGTDQFKKMQMQMNNAGFLTDQGTSLLSQIQGAGGSASGAGAGSLASLGLGAQRGFNLTNAGNVLGSLTGLYGPNGGQQVDEATKRILQENIAKGFDKSQNTELLRRFTETTAGIIFQGEARGAGDVGRLTKDFGQLLGPDASMKQFGAAQSAYQEYQGLTSQTSGRGGALGMASFIKTGKFSKLSPMKIGNLMEIPENQLTATNSDVVAAASMQGVSAETMVTNILEAKQGQALSTVGLSTNGLSPLKNYLGKRSLRSIAGNKDEMANLKNNPGAYAAYQDLQERAHLIGGYGGDQQQIERMQTLLQGPAGYGPLSSTAGAAARIAGGTGGKKEEEYIAAQAGAEKQMTLNLKALEDNLYPTAQGIAALTQAIVGLGSAAHLLTDSERARGVYNASPTGAVATKDSMSRTPANGSKSGGASSSW